LLLQFLLHFKRHYHVDKHQFPDHLSWNDFKVLEITVILSWVNKELVEYDCVRTSPKDKQSHILIQSV